MVRNALGHLLVQGRRSGHVGNRPAKLGREPFSEQALARSRSAEDQSVTVRGQTRSRSAVMIAFKSLTA